MRALLAELSYEIHIRKRVKSLDLLQLRFEPPSQQFKPLLAPFMRARARTIFQCDAVERNYKCNRPYRPWAEIHSSHPIIAQHNSPTTIEIQLRLGHMLNTCFLHYTKALDDLEITSSAQNSLSDLESLLHGTSSPMLADLFQLVPQQEH